MKSAYIIFYIDETKSRMTSHALNIFRCTFQAAHQLTIDPAIPSDSLAWFRRSRAIFTFASWLFSHHYLICAFHQRSRLNVFRQSFSISESKATIKCSEARDWYFIAAHCQMTKAQRTSTTLNTQFLLKQSLTSVIHSSHSARIRSKNSLICCLSIVSSNRQRKHRHWEA